jgi:AcrR family transcriptional regulator
MAVTEGKKRSGAATAVKKVAKKTVPVKPRAELPGRRRQLVDAEIYNVATHLFSTKGYGSTSLQDIADTMGLSRPALYHYVRSKEDILAKLVEEFAESRAHELAAIIANRDLTATEKLRRFVIPTVRKVAEHPQRFRLLDRCENELPEEILKKHRAAKRAVRDAFVAVVTEGVAAGEFRPIDPNIAAFSLIGMCTWVAWWFTPSGPADIEATVNTIVDLAVSTVTRAPRTSSKVQASTPLEALQSIRRQVEALEVQLSRPDRHSGFSNGLIADS